MTHVYRVLKVIFSAFNDAQAFNERDEGEMAPVGRVIQLHGAAFVIMSRSLRGLTASACYENLLIALCKALARETPSIDSMYVVATMRYGLRDDTFRPELEKLWNKTLARYINAAQEHHGARTLCTDE